MHRHNILFSILLNLVDEKLLDMMDYPNNTVRDLLLIKRYTVSNEIPQHSWIKTKPGTCSMYIPKMPLHIN